jgi:hypothetical protein
MASSGPNRALLARASAVLTTGEVAATRIDLNEAWGGRVVVDLDFTIGSLTNVIVRFYGSMDGTTYKPIAADTGAVATETITATATRLYPMSNLTGVKFFRVSVQGTGTVTSSLCAITYRYLRRGSQ